MTAEMLAGTCETVKTLAIPAFVLSCGKDAASIRFEHLNSTLTATLGLENHMVRGRTPAECFPARVAETLLANYETCRHSARPYAYEELLDLNHRELWWETVLSPVCDTGGTVIGIIGIAVDITERKAREFRRAETESALRRLNDEIALFTSMTAHDVRGPLNKIASLSELTLDGFADLGDNKRDMILSMQKIASGSLKHIDSILTHAGELRKGTVETTTIDLGHVCRDIAAVVDPGAKLNIIAPDLFIDGEVTVLQIILRNLAENAARHAGGHLTIAVEGGGDGRLRFSVADDGPGFVGGASAFAETVRARKITKGNRGFGLAAVAHLVESRGGALWMGPPVFGTGTTICFDLPGRIVWDEADRIVDTVESLSA